MKNSVVLEGIVYSRTAIEKALEELNEPDPVFRAGDLVTWAGRPRRGHYMVVGGGAYSLAGGVLKHYTNFDASRPWTLTIITDGDGVWEARTDELIKVGSLQKEV